MNLPQCGLVRAAWPIKNKVYTLPARRIVKRMRGESGIGVRFFYYMYIYRDILSTCSLETYIEYTYHGIAARRVLNLVSDQIELPFRLRVFQGFLVITLLK
jgi:hypothetical protein